MQFTNMDHRFRLPNAKRLLQWKLGLHPEKIPSSPRTGVQVPFVQNDGKLLQQGQQDTLTWIGHASYLLQAGGKNLLIDPVLSQSLAWIRRNVPPGLNWNTLPQIDVVLITHNHRDHMDAFTLKKLGNSPVYVVPQGLKTWFIQNGFQRVIEMQWWQQESVAGFDITFVPAEHWSRRGLQDTNTSWWGGYVIERGGIVCYHSGDTGWFEGFSHIQKRCPRIHAAMLPIGAYAPRWFMEAQHINPQEAVQAFQALNAAHCMPMHWGCFKLSDEPLDEPPRLFQQAWEQAQLPESRKHIMAIGETLLFDQLA